MLTLNAMPATKYQTKTVAQKVRQVAQIMYSLTVLSTTFAYTRLSTNFSRGFTFFSVAYTIFSLPITIYCSFTMCKQYLNYYGAVYIYCVYSWYSAYIKFYKSFVIKYWVCKTDFFHTIFVGKFCPSKYKPIKLIT